MTREYDTLAVTISGTWSGGGAEAGSYHATQGFTTAADEVPANAVFSGRLAEDIGYSRSVSCLFWATRGSSAMLANVPLINIDGGLDGYGEEAMRDRTVEVWRGSRRNQEPFQDWELCARGVIDYAEDSSESRTDLVLADLSGVLDQPVQDRLYTSPTNTALEGLPKPLCIGTCYSVPMTLVSLVPVQYDLHESAPYAVLNVRTQGVAMVEFSQWNSVGSGVELTVQPAGRMVADVQGAQFKGDFVSTLPAILRWLLVDRVRADDLPGPLTEDQVDWDSVDALHDAAPYSLCYYADRPVTYRQILTELLDSFLGWWWIDRLGRLAVGRLEEPSETPVMVIRHAELAVDGQLRRTRDRAPGYSNIITAQRNWHVHAPGEIANSLTDPVVTQIALDLQADYRYRKQGALPAGVPGGLVSARPGARIQGTGIPTVLSEPADADAEVARWADLYAVPRFFFQVPVLVAPSDALQLEPGQTVRLEIPRFGCDAGKNLLVVGVSGRLLSGRVDLTLWG